MIMKHFSYIYIYRLILKKVASKLILSGGNSDEYTNKISMPL